MVIEGALKLLLAGADVTMMASALFRHGPEHLGEVLRDMETWLDEHEYDSVEQMKGSVSRSCCDDPAAFERTNCMEALTTYPSPYDWRGGPGSPRA